MKLVEFTAPDGATDMVNVDQVVDVKHPDPGVYEAHVRGVIFLTNGFRAVRETPAEIFKKLGEA